MSVLYRKSRDEERGMHERVHIRMKLACSTAFRLCLYKPRMFHNAVTMMWCEEGRQALTSFPSRSVALLFIMHFNLRFYSTLSDIVFKLRLESATFSSFEAIERAV